jgi:hypothetical protein
MLTKILACSAVIAALAGCGSRVTLRAAPASLGAVEVRVVDAYTFGSRVTIKTVVTNTSSKPVAVDRDGFDLRVAGKLLEHRSGVIASHAPITVDPGRKRDIDVGFRADHDLGDLARAALVVGGVSIPAGAPPKVVGEIVLSASSAP